MPAAPNGLNQIHLGGGSTAAEANELAMTVALQNFSAQSGKAVKDLYVLGFDNSHHGSTTATLSVSGAAANPHKLPAFPWPKAPYPQLQFPIADFEHQNNAEEDRCVRETEALITGNSQWGSVGAIIVEPVSSIGHQFATPRFFKGLRKLAAEHGIPFIVDETKSGVGASGKNWAHEYWYLHDDQVPDFMTFGGKTGLSGFYSSVNHRLNDNSTSFQQ
jgi:4-aminobutyrate aminotransferase/(S)-3-amino-2-methylpropionate transaminase